MARLIRPKLVFAVMSRVTELRVNGKHGTMDADEQPGLLDILRNQLNQTGTQCGSGEGRCRVCTVLLDGKPVDACLTTADETARRPITAIEGLAKSGPLYPIQQVYPDVEALQCCYCTSAVIMTGVALHVKILTQAKNRPEVYAGQFLPLRDRSAHR